MGLDYLMKKTWITSTPKNNLQKIWLEQQKQRKQQQAVQKAIEQAKKTDPRLMKGQVKKVQEVGQGEGKMEVPKTDMSWMYEWGGNGNKNQGKEWNEGNEGNKGSERDSKKDRKKNKKKKRKDGSKDRDHSRSRSRERRKNQEDDLFEMYFCEMFGPIQMKDYEYQRKSEGKKEFPPPSNP